MQFEDQLEIKAQTLGVSLKLWLQDEIIKGTNNNQTWIRKNEPNPSNFFERIQNPHLIPVMMAAFVFFVFLVSLIS